MAGEEADDLDSVPPTAPRLTLRLHESRTLSRCRSLETEREWEEWSFFVRSHAGMVRPEVGHLMDQASVSTVEIPAGTSPAERTLQSDIYHMLVLTTTGPALALSLIHI